MSAENERQSDGTAAPEPESNLQAERRLPCTAYSALGNSGLRDTPITDSFEAWWAEHGSKCETMAMELGVKEAVERGFFGCHERSSSTFIKLNPIGYCAPEPESNLQAERRLPCKACLSESA